MHDCVVHPQHGRPVCVHAQLLTDVTHYMSLSAYVLDVIV
jgi:hypothetical protein